jgi:fatty-acyl-CoA synthase
VAYDHSVKIHDVLNALPVSEAFRRKTEEAVERVVDFPGTVKVAARVGHQTGMMWDLSLRGMSSTVRAIRAPNPAQLYRVTAANVPQRPALVWRDEKLTFSDVDERIDRLATGLERRGIGRKASILVMMKNRPEFVLIQGAAGRMAAAGVSVSWRSTASELTYLAENSGAVAICFEEDALPVVREVAKAVPRLAANLIVLGARAGECPAGCIRFEELLGAGRTFEAPKNAEEDAAVVIYTSGTTGKPKGAVRKFPRDMLPAALRFIAETPMRSDDVHLVACPMYHSTAYGFLTLAHLVGATSVLMDEFRPETFLELVERYSVTTTAVVPTMLHRLLSLPEPVLSRANTRSLRLIFTGGAPLPGPLGQAVMDRFGDILYNFYGATETGLVTLATPKDLRAAPTTIGRAVPGNDIRLTDDHGNDVPDGEVGELWVKNKLLVVGYHEDAKATSESTRDGYFSVGDLARRDVEGRYFIEGRKRDMIISAGVNIYPAEVEGVLEQHPDVAEVAVVGLPDDEFGEKVTAFLTMREGTRADAEALKAWMRDRLAGPKRPREYVFLEKLPRNPTGKVLKRELRG